MEATLTIGELEAKYFMYCKAMRTMVSEGRSTQEIERSLCWHRMALLHRSLPAQYKAPDHLLLSLRRCQSITPLD
ncbi:DUF3136 domain-containing protein [Synechococcus sp. RSCCF101]|uniref:DUF3136 domain-containing protein n=1 Tax=Synechococcus sp. RSCCF101 TaxID=2511069 RepID=UPI00351A25E5